MGRKLTALFVLLCLVLVALPAQGQIITRVERRNPDGNSGDTEPAIAPGPLGEKSPCFVDRTHIYVTVPEILLGTEYIMTANDDKDNPNYEMDVTVSKATRMYLIVDNRVGTAVGNSPNTNPNLAAANMNWAIDLGFVDTGFNVAIDESNDGDIDQWFSIFALDIPAGKITLKAENTSYNMYGVAVSEPQVKARKPMPADGAQAVTMPLFQWTAGGTAILHNLYLGTSPDLTEADLVGKSLTGPVYYHGPGLQAGTTYYWRVDEIEVDMTTVHTGDVWSFAAASISASRPAPADGAKWVDPNMELSWIAGKDAFSHDVYFSTDKAAVENADASAFQTNLYVPTWKPPALKPDTAYYWRVDELTADGTKTAGAVWSFTTIQAIATDDPSLLAWWTMDEGVGTTVVDWSGHGRHLAFGSPTPTWSTGHFGGALEFAGNGDSAVRADGSFLNGLDALTITVWVKSDVTNTDKGFIIFENPVGNDNHDMRYDAAGSTGGGAQVQKMGVTVAVDATTNTTIQLESSNNSQTTDWQHVTMVWSSGQALQFYINGKLDAPTANSTAVTGTLTGFATVIVGRAGKDTPGSWDGLVDEIRIYSKALTQEDIELIMRGDPLLAWDPSPANGVTTDAIQAVPLTWQAGDQAAKHDVYLGTDQAAVNNADASDATGIYRGRQTGTSFTPAPELVWGQKYFWRVDEVNGDDSISRGFVWSFTLTDYLIVDDFESYNDEEDKGTRIYETWIDGWVNNDSGSTIGNWDPPFAERTIIHGGRQSMPMDYNNVNSPFYSEGYREFTPVQNWMVGGVDTLSLWVRGNPVAYVEDAGVITMSGAGHDIWDTADDFRFAHKSLSGNGSITAKVESIVNTNGWAKAGVMIRQSLDADSKFVYMVVSAAQGVSFGWRQLPATACGSVTQTGVAAPQWVKLTRTGDVFTAQYSADGTTWLDVKNADGTVASTTVAMTGTPYIGLCVTSHNAAATTTAVFSNVTTSSGVTGSSWRVTAIGDDPQPANGAGTLYVTVQDSTNKTATVSHPTAVTTGAWTEWKIPLSDLAGVNLSKVKKLSICVGDKKNPQQDGSGRIYVDDIRVVKPAP